MFFVIIIMLVGLAIGAIFSENIKEAVNSIVTAIIVLAIRLLHKINRGLDKVNRRLDKFAEK